MAKQGGQDTKNAVGWLGRSGYQIVIVDPKPSVSTSSGDEQREAVAAKGDGDQK